MTDGASWFPVALGAELEAGASAGTRLLGRELVVWRDGAGRPHVWADRCPHRGMRLSFGFVRGDRIACLYHGWQFDSAGQCARIPAHPQLRPPRTIRAPVHAAVERLGLVWTGHGPAMPPGQPPGGDEAVVPVRSLALRGPAQQAVDGLLAVADAPFPGAGAVRAEQSGPLVILQAGGHRWVAAVQPVSDAESTVHLVILGAPERYRGAGQLQVSAWGEALRRKIEAAA